MKKLGLLIWILFFLVKLSFAQVAIFPFRDFSGNLDVNIKFANELAKYLASQGMKVVYPKDVIKELIKLRIKRIGFVDKLVAREIALRLKAQYIILGSIYDLNKNVPTLCMGIRILRTKDCKIIWGRIFSYCGRDHYPILGIDKPTYKEILYQGFDYLFAGFKEKKLSVLYPKPVLEMEDVVFKTRSIRTGNIMEVALKLKISGPKPEELKLSVGDKKLVPLVKKGIYYVGFWNVEFKEGRYPIMLIAKWHRIFNMTKKLFVGYYTVDNTPPQVKLKFIGVKKIGNLIAFSKYLEIKPRLLKKEKIVRWKLEIISPDNKVIATEEKLGALPQKLFWKGVGSEGNPVPSGIYTIKLNIWDQAENLSIIEKKVLVVKTPPQVELKAFEIDHKIKLIINLKKHIVPIRDLRVEIWDNKGNLIKRVSKKELEKGKVVLTGLPLHISYEILAVDVLGNKLYLKKKIYPKVLKLQKIKNKKKIPKAKEWVHEF